MYLFYYEHEDEDEPAPPRRPRIWRAFVRDAGLAAAFYGLLTLAIYVGGWVGYL